MRAQTTTTRTHSARPLPRCPPRRLLSPSACTQLPFLGWALHYHHTVFIHTRPDGRAPKSSLIPWVGAEVSAEGTAAVSPTERARSVARDVADISGTAESLTTHHPDYCGQPVWIGLYPEGTRLIPEQHKRALAFAQEHERQAYKYLLQPRVKGLDTVLRGVRPRISHALDLTVAYEGFSAECEKNRRPAGIRDGLFTELCVHVLIRRLPLPTESDDTQRWLEHVWSEKERALSRWEHDGSFEAERIELDLPVRPLVSAFVFFSLFVALCAAGAVQGAVALYHRVSQ